MLRLKRDMKWIGLLSLAGIAASACSSPTMPECAANPFGCRCSNDSFDVSFGTAASGCSSEVVGQPVQCCFDLASDGTTTDCRCYAWVCEQDQSYSSACDCNWVGLDGTPQKAGGAGSGILPTKVVSGCSATGSGSCCTPGTDSSCTCTASSTQTSGACEPQWATVTSCGQVPTLSCPIGLSNSRTHGPASSCNGLRWAAPSSSQGGGGGNCTPTGGYCGGDVDCCAGHRCNIPAGYATGSCS